MMRLSLRLTALLTLLLAVASAAGARTAAAQDKPVNFKGKTQSVRPVPSRTGAPPRKSGQRRVYRIITPAGTMRAGSNSYAPAGEKVNGGGVNHIDANGVFIGGAGVMNGLPGSKQSGGGRLSSVGSGGGGGGGPLAPEKSDSESSKSADPSGASGAAAASGSSSLRNFVAGSKADCENNIRAALGTAGVCTIGGGCGVTCGKPSATCQSANPSAYGACLEPTSAGSAAPAPAPVAAASSSMHNFVAGSIADCERSIREMLGFSAACTIGGGCGVTCGKPGANCASANPSLPGACLSGAPASSSSSPSTPPPPAPEEPAAQLYNFVAGSKATCESSIQSRLGIQGSCRIGGGCGINCGAPSPTCASANPTLYGACILH